MRFQKVTLETTLYTLALILALGVRFLNLGAAPLSEREAGWAFQAWRMSRSPVAASTMETLDLSAVESRLEEPGPQPAYLLLTSGLFTLFGSSNFMARFWPALAGSLLVLTPLIAGRRWRFLHAAPGIIMAFGLALDPGMVAVSRTAGSAMMALGFGGLALAFWVARFPIPAGISASAALLSGPAALHGLVILGIVWGVYWLLAGKRPDIAPGDVHPGGDGRSPWARFGALFALSAGLTIIFLGTLFSLYPQGLSLAISAIPTYIETWLEGSGIPADRLLVALAVYQPLGLIFGLAALGGAWINPDWSRETNEAVRLMSIVLIVGTAVILVHPSRQVSDVIWVLYPLWALAALELSRHLPGGSHRWLLSLGQAIFLFTLAVLVWLTLIGTLNSPTDPRSMYLRLGVIAGVAALGGLTTVLVAYGWSWGDARRGLVWGVWAALSIYMLACLWSASQVEGPARRLVQQNLWDGYPQPGQVRLLHKTLGDLSQWNTGRRQAIDVVVAVESPSVYWALREFPNAKAIPEAESNSVQDIPSIIITRQLGQEPRLGALYRGQDFTWWIYPQWEGAAPPDFIRWLAFRRAPVRNESLILWARGDLFPGGTLPTSGGTPDSQSTPDESSPGGGPIRD